MINLGLRVATRQLREQLVTSDPHATFELHLVSYPLADAARHGHGIRADPPERTEVAEHFVETQRLDHWGFIKDDGVKFGRYFFVAIEVARNDDEVGAQSLGEHRGGSGLHPKTTRFVASRCHYPSIAVTADDHGFTSQRRIIQNFDRRKESIQVYMENRSGCLNRRVVTHGKPRPPSRTPIVRSPPLDRERHLEYRSGHH